GGDLGQRHLWIIDATAGGRSEPRRLTELPGNSVQPAVSPDGRFVAFIHSGPYRSPDLWLLELRAAGPGSAGGPAPAGDAASAGGPAPAGEPVQLTRSMPAAWRPEVQTVGEPVTFPADDGFQVPGYLFVPQHREGERLPAIVWLHGGPMRQMRYGWHPMPS